MKHLIIGLAALGVAATAGCASHTGGADQPIAPMAAVEARAAIEAAVANPARTAAQTARDAQRYPAASLAFWGLEPGMDILEIQPGGEGWWTYILAPFARDTGGSYAATASDLANPNISPAARQARDAWVAQFITPGDLGPISLVNWGQTSAPLAAESVDFILTSRSIHGWIRGDMVDKAFADMFAALRPGGVLAVEQHRANPEVTDPASMGASGYVSEAYVIAAAARAGFQLAGRSEINANAADTKDHPFGVWTLPPTRRTSSFGQPDDPSFDRARFDAIGESDRMTLRFVKPA